MVFPSISNYISIKSWKVFIQAIGLCFLNLSKIRSCPHKPVAQSTRILFMLNAYSTFFLFISIDVKVLLYFYVCMIIFLG